MTTPIISNDNDEDVDNKMIVACKEGDEETVQSILNSGTYNWKRNLHWFDKEHVELDTPAIFIAIDYNQYKIVQLLLLHNKEKMEEHVNIKDANDYSPFTWASMNGYESLVELLLAHGATVDQDAADMAKENGYSDIVKILKTKLDVYADIDKNDVDEIMIRASREGDIEKVRALIEQGYDFDRWKMPDGEGYRNYSPIFFALKNGHIDVIQEFLQAGVEAELQETHFNHQFVDDEEQKAETAAETHNTELTPEEVQAISEQFMAAEENEELQDQSSAS